MLQGLGSWVSSGFSFFNFALVLLFSTFKHVFALLDHDLVLGEHLLELREVKTNDIIEDTVHWLFKLMQATRTAFFGKTNKLDNALQVELLADPEELIDRLCLLLFAFERNQLLRLTMRAVAFALEPALCVLHQLLKLLSRYLVVSARQCSLLK